MFAILSAVTLVASAGGARATTVEQVDGRDLGDEWSTADTRGDGEGFFAEGPGEPPFGEGSFHMATTDSNQDKVQLMTTRFAGTPLSDVEQISYHTYRDSATTHSVAMPAINLRVDCDGDGVADTYLVAEPYWQDGSPDSDEIVDDTWQHWQMIEPGGDDDRWWSSRDCGTLDAQIGGPGDDWSTVLASAPNASIAEGDDGFAGSVGLNLGSFNPGVISAADGLRVVLGSGTDVTFDFEATPPPTCGTDGFLDDSGVPGFDDPGTLLNTGESEDGPVSRPIHDAEGDAGPAPVHEVNCDAVVTVESLLP